MRHVEGGWPKDVDFTEQSDVSRFRKKAEKDDDYKGAVKALGPIIARCLKQNNTIDIYEVHFKHGDKCRPIYDDNYLFNGDFRTTLMVTMSTIVVNHRVQKVWPCSGTPTKLNGQPHQSIGTQIPQHQLKSQFLIQF